MPGHFNVEQIDWADWAKTLLTGGGLAWLFNRRAAKQKEKSDTRTLEQASIIRLQADVARLDETVKGNSERIDNLEHERHTLLEQIIGYKETISKLNIRILVLETEKGAAEERDVTQSAIIEELNARLAAAKGERRAVEKQLATLTDKMHTETGELPL